MVDYTELVKNLREPCPHENCILCQNAANAIEGLEKITDAQNDIIKQYKASLAKARASLAETRWIPVTERLPKESCKCLVYTERGEYGGYDITSYSVMTMAFLDYEIGCEKVTHWMPLPEPPKEEP